MEEMAQSGGEAGGSTVADIQLAIGAAIFRRVIKASSPSTHFCGGSIRPAFFE